MAIFLFACLTAFFALFAYWKHSRLLQFLLQFLPFCFLFFFLWFIRNQYEIIQVQKLGYQFEKITNDYRSPARPVMIGGNQQADDLFSQKLPGSAVKITPSLADNSLDLRVLQDGVLVLRNGDPLNEIRLRDGDRIAIGKQEMEYHAKGAFGRSFSSGDKNWSWPREARKTDKITKPSFAAGFLSQIHALSELGDALKLPLQSGGAVYLEPLHFAPGRRPLEINCVGLIGALNVVVNSIRAPDHFSIHNGDVIALYAISSDENGARIDPAFNVRVSNGESLAFYHTNPQTVGMKEELLRSGGSVDKPLLITTTTLPYSAFPTVHYGLESESFNGLSAFVQLQHAPEEDGIFARFDKELTNLLAIEQRRVEIVTDDGVYHPEDGQPFSLGKTERILFSLHEVRFPWQILQILLLLVVLKMIFQPPFFESVQNPPAQLLLITIDFFLALRLLFAFRADSLFPFSHKALDLSLFAWLLIPYLMFAALLCKRENWERTHFLNFVSYSVLTIVISLLIFPQYFVIVVGFAMIAGAIAFVRFHPRSFWPQVQMKIERIRNTKVEVFSLAVLAIALLFYFFSAGEALEIRGMRVPLALFYHPVFLLLSCKYLLDLNRISQTEKTEETLRDAFRLLLKSGLLLIEFLMISFLMADLGFFLLYCLPVLFLLFGSAVLLISQYELKWKLAGLLACVPIVLMFVVLFSTSTIEGFLPQSYFDNRYVQRILLAVDPTALEESGLIVAERQLGHQRTFLAYAHGGWRGAGYMQRPITTALSATALNDNVPSVFLLNDFGVLGASGVLLILLLWLWLWTRSRPDPGFSYPRMLSLAALITIVFVDLYMILSNCGIFLFTGKNVFLWGLNSTSDLLHSAILFGFLILPISKIPETAIPPGELELPMTFVGELRRVES